MLPFTQIEQQTLDIDWFFTNGNEIGHVGSGGGQMPSSVAESKESLRTLYSYFAGLPDRCEMLFNPELKNIKANADKLDWSSFTEMTNKGLYSYDRTNSESFSGSEYHLIASPVDSLKFDELPEHIQKILVRSSYEGEMKGRLDISLIR